MSTIITKNSSTAAAVPLAGDLVKGELAVNVTDKKLYTKDNSGTVFLLASATAVADSAASAALANDWATKTAGPVAGGEYSAKYHAQAASTSASSASASASTASAAQTAAESARDATLAAYDSFDDRYLGTKSSNPTVDNDGNALVAGALYFNSVAQEMRLYTGSAWVAAYVSGASYATLTGTETLTNKTIAYSNNTLTGVQPTLVSGTNIKTVGGNSLLGSGDVTIITPKAANVQTFNSSGTWTKPTGFGASARVLIQCWGGGGSGGLGSHLYGSAGGGGGGGYEERWMNLSELASSVTATVGAGGAAMTTVTISTANPGGNTSFGTHIYAYGGGGGCGTSGSGGAHGGGGGGSLSAGTNATSGQGLPGRPYIVSPAIRVIDNTILVKTLSYIDLHGTAGAAQSAGCCIYYPYIYLAEKHGGGGGSHAITGVNSNSPGAPSVYGGGGGGSVNSVGGGAKAGGTSTYGGAGGAAGLTTGNAGVAPGGGGGGGREVFAGSGSSGAGAAGRIVVTVFDGA